MTFTVRVQVYRPLGNMKVVLLLGLLGLAYGGTLSVYNSVEIINSVNSANTTWKAGHNFANDIPLRYIQRLLGVKKSPNNIAIPVKSHDDIGNDAIPDQFDARKHWPNCPSIKHIRDQGDCGSCWAVAAASALSDRVCIVSNAKFKKPLSTEELLTCCKNCGDGCNGGDPDMAWLYFQENGIVTGGDYHSHVGCQPYQIQPCEHHTTGKRPQCSTLPSIPTPECKSSCINPHFKGKFEPDHHKVKTRYRVKNQVEDIQKEILKNGPVEVSFTVYEDFPSYKSGVYQYIQGKILGSHSVKLIGWGKENNVPYWLISNSWNTDWGDKGTFKIIRGKNECGIEDEVDAGEVAI